MAALETAVNLQPVTVAIQAAASYPGGPNPVQSYAGGIIKLSDGCGQELDHSVLVVGYGHDATLGMDFWWVKNSWSATWGLGGYFRVEKSSQNACGLLNEGKFPNLGTSQCSSGLFCCCSVLYLVVH